MTPRNLAIALSLANLCLIGIWADLLPFLYLTEGFPIGAFPCRRDFAAVVLNVAGLSLVFALAGAYARRLGGTPRVVARLALVAVLLVILNAIRMHFNTWPERWLGALPAGAAAVTVILAALAGAAATVRWNQAVSKAVQVALVIMLPLAPVMMAQALWASATLECGEASRPPPMLQPPGGSARVLWIVFDELEERALFEKRPADLELPAFDRLRRESISATRALAPATETERSIPSYLTGRPVSRALVTGPNQLFLQFEGSTSREPLDEQTTLFSHARRLGLNTALAGWFLPYCSILADELNACSWEPCVTCGRRVGTFGATLSDSMVSQLSELAPRHGPRHHVRSYSRIRTQALELAGDRRYQFVFLHFPVPHDPWIYDGREHELTWLRPGPRGYFDNLVLADDTLAAVREAMERAGAWDGTHVLVLGDHGWREPDGFDGGALDHRVPLLVKIAGESTGRLFERGVTALKAHQLTLGLMNGAVRSVQDAMRTLENGSMGRLEYGNQSSTGR